MTDKRYPSHPYRWAAEPLTSRASYEERSMFGCRSCYLNGKLVLVLADNDDPWDGVLLPVERKDHASIMSEFPELEPHAVLGKWLHAKPASDHFEETVTRIVEFILSGDERFGVTPKPRKRRRKNPPIRP